MRKFSRHRSPSPHLSLLKAIQAGFGLTQERIADILGVSRATLTQYSRSTPAGSVRGLPAAATLRLLAFQQALPAPYGPASAPPDPELPPPPALPVYDQQTLSMRRQQIKLQEHQLEQRLARCKLHLAQARLRQQALPALRAALTPTDDELTQPWLAVFAGEARRILEKETPAATLLALQLRVLAFETAEIDKLLTEEAPKSPGTTEPAPGLSS